MEKQRALTGRTHSSFLNGQDPYVLAGLEKLMFQSVPVHKLKIQHMQEEDMGILQIMSEKETNYFYL